MNWTDKDGVEYEPQRMTDSHLTNTLNYIRKFIEDDANYIPPPAYKGLLKEYNERAIDDSNRCVECNVALSHGERLCCTCRDNTEGRNDHFFQIKNEK